jgi:protein-disulfide isomerase
LKKEKTEKFKKLLIWLTILGAVGFLGYKLWKGIQTPQDETGGSILSVRSDDWVKGSPDAKVTVIEYADFECPACAIYSTEILKKLADEYKDNLRIVYRHFPLSQLKSVDAARRWNRQEAGWVLGYTIFVRETGKVEYWRNLKFSANMQKFGSGFDKVYGRS